MKKDYTHIAIILDRTGSMESIRDDTIGGFNTFLSQQKAGPGSATLTLVQFDTQDPYEVIHHMRPIGQIPNLTRETYVPRAATPLLDALGRGVNDIEKSIAEMPEEERPEKVLVAIITDGKENSSREFKREQVARMIQEKTEKNGWMFTYLSADFDAFDEAQSLGIHQAGVLTYAKTRQGTQEVWENLNVLYQKERSK
jgi:hypothetical protein